MFRNNKLISVEVGKAGNNNDFIERFYAGMEFE